MKGKYLIIMRIIKLLTIFSFVLLLNSCAKKLYVTYPADGIQPGEKTGKIILKPVSPTARTFVTVNGNLLVDKKTVKSITIDNVPVGETVVTYSSESSGYKEALDHKNKISVEEYKTKTEIIKVPPKSTGYWIYAGLSVILLFGVLFLL